MSQFDRLIIEVCSLKYRKMSVPESLLDELYSVTETTQRGSPFVKWCNVFNVVPEGRAKTRAWLEICRHATTWNEWLLTWWVLPKGSSYQSFALGRLKELAPPESKDVLDQCINDYFEHAC